jgi:hypothetical protein
MHTMSPCTDHMLCECLAHPTHRQLCQGGLIVLTGQDAWPIAHAAKHRTVPWPLPGFTGSRCCCGSRPASGNRCGKGLLVKCSWCSLHGVLAPLANVTLGVVSCTSALAAGAENV